MFTECVLCDTFLETLNALWIPSSDSSAHLLFSCAHFLQATFLPPRPSWTIYQALSINQLVDSDFQNHASNLVNAPQTYCIQTKLNILFCPKPASPSVLLYCWEHHPGFSSRKAHCDSFSFLFSIQSPNLFILISAHTFFLLIWLLFKVRPLSALTKTVRVHFSLFP